MISVDSLAHAFTIPITIGAWLVCLSATADADAPPPETFTKPAELVLTLSDDLPQTENPQFSANSLTTPNNNADKFTSNTGKNGALDMDCGMDGNPDTAFGNSAISRLSGACDLKLRY